MDIKKYYADVRAKEAELEKEFPNRVVHITSLEVSEKNITPGATCSANPYKAASCIVDRTHRLATQEEIQAFLDLQEKNRTSAVMSEMRKRQQLVTVVRSPEEAFAGAGVDAGALETAGSGGKRGRS